MLHYPFAGCVSPCAYSCALVSHYATTKPRLPRPPTSTLPFLAVANLDSLVVTSTSTPPFTCIAFPYYSFPLAYFFLVVSRNAFRVPLMSSAGVGNTRCRVPTIRVGSRPLAHLSPSRLLLPASFLHAYRPSWVTCAAIVQSPAHGQRSFQSTAAAPRGLLIC